jgi:hypothetical protein
MENWKVVEGHEAYEVSDLGRIRRIKAAKGATVGKVLRATPNRHGYLTVTFWENNVGHPKEVARVVAKAFIPNPLNLAEVNHTGEKSDNRATKLEWITKQKHNVDKAIRNQQGTGVCFRKANGKWHAMYHPVPNKRKHIGYYDTKEEALEARHKVLSALQEGV